MQVFVILENKKYRESNKRSEDGEQTDNDLFAREDPSKGMTGILSVRL
jgi:hypothetical protein